MHHDHPFHILDYDIKDKTDLMWHTLLKMLGATLFSVFVPAILYFELGLSLSQVFLFFGIHSLLSLLIQWFFSAHIIAQRGTKLSMIVGVCGAIGYMLILMFVADYPQLIFVAPLFSAIHTAFFWLAFHYNMSLRRRKESTLGRKHAAIEIAKTLAAASGPLLGGWLADERGMGAMFGTAIVFVLLSVIPFFHTHAKHTKQKFSLKKQTKLIRKNKNLIKKVVITFGSIAYIQYIGAILWSIALFAFFQNFTKMGGITTLTTFLVVFCLYMIGSLSDHDDAKAKKVVSFSSWLQGTSRGTAAVLMFLGLLSQISYIFIDMFQKLSYKINNTYLTKIFYDESGIVFEKNPLYLVILRESSIHIAKVVLSLVFAILFWMIGSEVSYLSIPFVLVLVAVPLQLVLMRKKYRKSH